MKSQLAKQRLASQSAPKGYAHLKRVSLFDEAGELGWLVTITRSLLGDAWYVLTCRAYGTFAPRLRWTKLTKLAVSETNLRVASQPSRFQRGRRRAGLSLPPPA